MSLETSFAPPRIAPTATTPIPHHTVLARVNVSATEFQDRTGINLERLRRRSEIQAVVSPRDMKRIEEVTLMPAWYRDQLLRCVTLVGDETEHIYENARMFLSMVDPSRVRLGQRYVYRSRYMSIVECLPNLFQQFSLVPGFSRIPMSVMFGEDADGRPVIGNYLPPIVEVHNNQYELMDGCHRGFLGRQAGHAVEMLVIEGVSVPFPCETRDWAHVSIRDRKPDRVEDRFWELDQQLFRNLKHIGIDG